MKHFTIEEWTDFARGLVEGAARSAMETHRSSCPRCERSVKLLRDVAVTARAEAGYEPPERAIWYAQALFSLLRPETVSFPRLVARLIHDSGRAPLPAGMRSQTNPTRHALYEAGSYYLDVQLEHQPSSGLISLTGQLADRNQPAGTITELPVWLMERQRLVASTVSNRFGEFHLEYAPALNLRLQVPLPAEGKRLDVSLTRLSSGPAPAPRPARVAAGRTKRSRT